MDCDIAQLEKTVRLIRVCRKCKGDTFKLVATDTEGVITAFEMECVECGDKDDIRVKGDVFDDGYA